MTVSFTCPDPRRLQDLIDAALATDEQEELSRHLDGCEACRQKLYAMRQVRLALGRNASRVARVLVIDDDHALDAGTQAADAGLDVVRIATQARGDRAHIYLADPHGNVMLRWPSNPDLRRMYQDIDRLLKASQIG